MLDNLTKICKINNEDTVNDYAVAARVANRRCIMGT